MFMLLLILFTAVPALEFYLLFEIGSAIGAPETFAIIIVTGIAGAYLAKSQGLAILQKIQQELAQGQMPGRPILHGFLVFGGGLLLLTPGFLTDILGLCLVTPGTRHIIAGLLMEYFKKGIANGNIVFVNSATPNRPQDDYPEQELPSDVLEAEYSKKEID
ncbi:MAG: FxsA family protein [Halobacteriovoraceae bacterium]|jgi:UPF0716 protein FxsA|nr:FxsA family protein [Halobacteriovoraceae bacterium]MBT5094114.1 FxsA family protein [Halobacteriovoraceae bacterium]